MIRVEKKAWPELFEKVRTGEKNFDVRLNNFKCKSGDILVLREWDPILQKYTGRIIEKKVRFVLRTKDVRKFWTKEEIKKYGFQVIGF